MNKYRQQYKEFKEQTQNKVIDFDEVITVRLKKSDLKDIEKILKKDTDDRYDSQSHFIRCAIRKQLRMDFERLNL